MLTDKRHNFKPFEYSWAHEFYKKQQSVHWVEEEIAMASDLNDWNFKLTAPEKNLIGNILKGFTQMEVLVGDYWRNVAEWFPKPEICQMAACMSYFETIHQNAYDLLNATLGLNDYNAFIHEEEIKNKIDALIDTKSDSNLDKLVSLAVFSAFTEGVSIFSSFAILLSFQTRNLLKSVGQIVTFSVRDESLHSKAGIKLFNVFKDELKLTPEQVNEVATKIQEAAKLVYELECNYIDTCFSLGSIVCRDDVSGRDFMLTPSHIKSFIKHRISSKLLELQQDNTDWLLNIDEMELIKEMRWFDNLSSGAEFQDFFAGRVTEYGKYYIKAEEFKFDN